MISTILIQPFVGINGLAHKPALSRTGAKTRFAAPLQGILGYHPRDVALEWNNDSDLGCWLYALCRACPELAREVSRIISAWVPCPSCLPGMVTRARAGEVKPDPAMCATQTGLVVGCPVCGGSGARDARQLWEELRKAPIPAEVQDAAAVWGFLQARAFSRCSVVPWPDGQHPWGMMRESRVSTITFCPEQAMGNTSGQFAGWFNPRWAEAAKFASLPKSAPAIVTRIDAGLVTPERLASTLAAWMLMQSQAPAGKPVTPGKGGWHDHGFRYEFDPTGGHDGTHARGWQNPRWTLASSLPGSDVPALVTRLDAGLVVPEVLATWMYLQANQWGNKPVVPDMRGGWNALRGDGRRSETIPEEFAPTNIHYDAGSPIATSTIASRLSSLPTGSLFPVDASLVPEEDVPLPPALPWTGRPYRCVVYIDPPYLGRDGDGGKTTSTGYGDTFTRQALLELCRRWLEAGKRDGIEVVVGVSESCNLSAELEAATGQRWHGYDVGAMVKRKSGFWAGDDGDGAKQSEWVTVSRPAGRLLAMQGVLW